jgi:hypothetical protein
MFLLISNFYRVLNVVCFMLGNSSASEFIQTPGNYPEKAYNNIHIFIFIPLETWGCFVARINVHGLGIIKELLAKHVIFFTASVQSE